MCVSQVPAAAFRAHNLSENILNTQNVRYQRCNGTSHLVGHVQLAETQPPPPPPPQLPVARQLAPLHYYCPGKANKKPKVMEFRQKHLQHHLAFRRPKWLAGCRYRCLPQRSVGCELAHLPSVARARCCGGVNT